MQYIIRNLFYEIVRNLSHPLIFCMPSSLIVNDAFKYTHNNCFVVALRAKLREKRGIDGSLTNDIILTICCGYCTLVQVCITPTIEFSLNVFTEFVELYYIFKRLFELFQPATSCMTDQDATTVPARHR